MASKTDQPLILTLDDIKAAAVQKLSTTARGEDVYLPSTRGRAKFYEAGSADQITVHENTTAYSKYRLRPRVLVDVSKADTTTKLFGQNISFPLCVSPAGIQAMAHRDGELATSRACAKRRVHMGVSSFSNYSVEQVREAGLAIGPLHHVMQLYTMQDRSAQLRIIRRAEEAGCVAIFLTGDSPVLGVRYNELRNDFRTPEGLAFPMLGKTSEAIRAQTHHDGFTSFNSDSHSWAKEIPWLRSVTNMQIWIKGILTAEDVQLAIQYGCDGVIVSNHGGRQLDQTPATIDVLPECVRAANGKINVHIDGGIRSGTDIFKAIALGAKCVWIGRPMIWGLAYDGEAGVAKTLDILYAEFKRCMQLCGCNSIDDITSASLGVVSKDGPLARL
ncbi:(S)-2-hydroxy-acid oxidase [Dactylonectria macrodidyma]|uniref:Oxidase FUB9 n=1 Tax=Dactylonectria macrodidyma TaxID=307937 RepID=A0A9P9J7Z6_9HYPO|nr:(S)-2-hydroxy-acid oxidase [Dactylonectria macrodidyma]